MEVERINDDTVRIKFDNSDLNDRGISFLDLVGNKDESENFFYGILEEIDMYEDFKDSEAVTFQVMPKKNGLEIFISKGADVDHAYIHELAHSDYDPEDGLDLSELLDEFGDSDDSKVSTNIGRPNTMVAFNNIEELMLLIGNIDTEYLNSKLYYYENVYYLYAELLDTEIHTDTYRTLLFSKIEEFGEKMTVSLEVLDEHGDCVIKDLALETLDYYFNN